MTLHQKRSFSGIVCPKENTDSLPTVKSKPMPRPARPPPQSKQSQDARSESEGQAATKPAFKPPPEGLQKTRDPTPSSPSGRLAESLGKEHDRTNSLQPRLNQPGFDFVTFFSITSCGSSRDGFCLYILPFTKPGFLGGSFCDLNHYMLCLPSVCWGSIRHPGFL